MKYGAHVVGYIRFSENVILCACGARTEASNRAFQEHRVSQGETPKTVAGSRALDDGKAGSFGHSRKR